MEEAEGLLLPTTHLRPLFPLSFSSNRTGTVPWEEVGEMTSLGMRHQGQLSLSPQEEEGGRHQKLSPEGAEALICQSALLPQEVYCLPGAQT